MCAVDTELLGHWWYEGVDWLGAVVEECSRQGLELVRLDDALERHAPAWRRRHRDERRTPAEQRGGRDGDLSTWSGPAVAEVAFALRRAELEVIAAGERAGEAAVRELLALQASDWAFMVAREIAAPTRASASRASAALAAGPRRGCMRAPMEAAQHRAPRRRARPRACSP